MFDRNEARPTPYTDRLGRHRIYDSALEAEVAVQLDALGVTWHPQLPPREGAAWSAGSYEKAPEDISAWYLPDFTIAAADAELDLPLWVEVKPAAMLAKFREHLGVQANFTDDDPRPTSASDFWKANFKELYKPRRLAELYGRDVLVVSEINRHRTLSLLMRPDGIVLSKRHPAVNRARVLADEVKAEKEAQLQAEREARRAEKARQRAQRDAEREAQRAEWEAAAAQRQAEQERELADLARHIQQNGRPARFDGWCLVCRTSQPACALLVARGPDETWKSLCKSCTS